ncbi:MAG: DUF3662 and FHA domain-containing protein [Anaerolineae bacterium]|jgi:hypothetical protein
MSRFARFEALAERLVEGTFSRLFAGHLHPAEVATHLARAIEDQRTFTLDGTPLAPTCYQVYLNPDDFEALVGVRPSLEEDLIEYISNLAREAGLVLTALPVVSVEASRDVSPHSARVEARQPAAEEVEAGGTREMKQDEREAIRAAIEEEPRGCPFLIVEGERHMELTEPLVSIGRALDNDVILEDSRVSRHHAQLRRRYGRYILYDLGSSGGTAINDYPVQECVLQPGDVISLAGAAVIYGEDPPVPPPDPEEEDTPAMTVEDADGPKAEI